MLGFIQRWVKEANTYKNPDSMKSGGQENRRVSAIIDGLLYDTANAESILSVYQHKNYGAPLIIDLYRTKNQRFFTVSVCGDIKPRTEEEVKCILSKFPDKYQETFGKVVDA